MKIIFNLYDNAVGQDVFLKQSTKFVFSVYGKL